MGFDFYTLDDAAEGSLPTMGNMRVGHWASLPLYPPDAGALGTRKLYFRLNLMGCADLRQMLAVVMGAEF
jgi:hypothetical protein